MSDCSRSKIERAKSRGDGLDELLVRTPSFRRMIARSRRSLKKGKPVSVEELLTEARAELQK